MALEKTKCVASRSFEVLKDNIRRIFINYEVEVCHLQLVTI